MWRLVWQGPDMRRAQRVIKEQSAAFHNDDPSWPAWGEPDLVYATERLEPGEVVDLPNGGYEVRGIGRS